MTNRFPVNVRWASRNRVIRIFNTSKAIRYQTHPAFRIRIMYLYYWNMYHIWCEFGVNLYALLLRLKRLSHKSFRLSFQLRFNTYITITQICDSFSEL